MPWMICENDLYIARVASAHLSASWCWCPTLINSSALCLVCWAFSWVIPWLRTCKDLYIQALDIEIWNSQKMDAARITHLHGLKWQTYSHMLAFLSIRQPRRDVLNEQSLVLLKAGPRWIKHEFMFVVRDQDPALWVWATWLRTMRKHPERR